MNALTLPPALRFNAASSPDAVARFGEAIGATDDPAARVEELARLGGFERLRDFGVPEDELPEVAEPAAQRPGQQANPRPATPGGDRGAAPLDLLNKQTAIRSELGAPLVESDVSWRTPLSTCS